MNDIEYEITVDDSKGRQAFERTNSTIDRMERMATSAAERMTRAFDSLAKVLFKVAEAAGAVYLLKKSWDGLVATTELAAGPTERLVNLYRAARITLSPTVFTATSLGLGILLEATLKMVSAEGELIERQALLSVRTKQSLADIQALAEVSRRSSVDVATLVGALSKLTDNSAGVGGLGVVGASGLGQRGRLVVLSEVIRELDKIQDPVERARRTFEVFGEDVGEKIFPRISERLADSIRRMHEFTDSSTLTNIDRMKRDLDALGDAFGSLGDKIGEAWRQFSRWVAATTSNAYAGIKDNISAFDVDQNRLRYAAASGQVSATTGQSTLQIGSGPLSGDEMESIMVRGILANLERGRAAAAGTGYQSRDGAIDLANARSNARSQTLEGVQARLAAARERRDRFSAQAAGAVGDVGRGVAADLYLQADAEVTRLEQTVKRLEAAKRKAEEMQRRTREFPQVVEEQMQRQSVEGRREGQRKFQQSFDAFVGNDPGSVENRMRAQAAETAQQAKVFGDAEQAYIDSLRKREDAELEHLAVSRDHQLAQLDTVNARTVAEKIAVEQRKAQIEAEYLNQRLEKEIDLLRRRTELEIQDKQKGIQDQIQLDAIRFQYEAALAEKIAVLRGQTADQIAAVQDKASVQSAQLQRSENQRTIDAFERGFEGLFAAAFGHAQSFTAALRSLFFAVVLAPVQQGLARMLSTAIFGGGGGTGGGATGGGLLSGVSGIFGGGNPASILGPGGTSGFSGPLGGIVQGGGGFGGLGGFGGIGGALERLGNIGYKTGTGFGGAGSGFGGTTGGLLLAGGGILAADGLRRGGVTGLFETTAGGAAIGAKFGGPIGALIGAAVGFGAGFIRLFIKGATDKAKEKIRSVYGVSIDDKGILQQIVEMAKQSYGGNLDVAIRSPQVRDLIQLYAMTTGQQPRAGTMPAVMQSATFAQSGGSLSYVPNYSNGTALPPVSSASGNAPTVNYFTMPAAAVNDAFNGRTVQVIQSNPQAVAGAQIQANSLNYGRRQQAVQYLNPGLVTV